LAASVGAWSRVPVKSECATATLLPTNFDQAILLQVLVLICTHFIFRAFKNFIPIEELHLHLPARQANQSMPLVVFGQNCFGQWLCAAFGPALRARIFGLN